jgi:hypothetical protein
LHFKCNLYRFNLYRLVSTLEAYKVRNCMPSLCFFECNLYRLQRGGVARFINHHTDGNLVLQSVFTPGGALHVESS